MEPEIHRWRSVLQRRQQELYTLCPCRPGVLTKEERKMKKEKSNVIYCNYFFLFSLLIFNLKGAFLP
jgi:hypothetical protein